MGLDVNALDRAFSLKSNIRINSFVDKRAISKKIDFLIKPDSVVRNPEISQFINSDYITNAIKRNPKIKSMLENAGMPVKINMHEIMNIKANHLPQTKNTVLGIVRNLPQQYKKSVDFQALQQASVLHDIGKSLIPENVVGKNGKLNSDELKKMQMHSELGYELLKDSKLPDKTKELIRNHHQNAFKTGYPEVNETYVSDINNQILHVADVYSALRENRVYKPAMTKNEALAILHGEMKKGNIHPHVFKALVDYANEADSALKSAA